METKFLILLGLLTTVSLVTASDCGASDLFKCKDGSGFIGGCVPGQRRCSGEKDCGDGSDEEGCDAHTVALPTNASVTVRVQFARLHRYVELHLCGARNCSTLMLHGERPDGTLSYEASASCNRLGRSCTNILEAHISGPHNFVFGEVVLEAQHRPGKLAVWPQGRPDGAAEVPVEADYGTLRVRPYVWSADMPVQFTEVEATSIEHPLLNKIASSQATAPMCRSVQCASINAIHFDACSSAQKN